MLIRYDYIRQNYINRLRAAERAGSRHARCPLLHKPRPNPPGAGQGAPKGPKRGSSAHRLSPVSAAAGGADQSDRADGFSAVLFWPLSRRGLAAQSGCVGVSRPFFCSLSRRALAAKPPDLLGTQAQGSTPDGMPSSGFPFDLRLLAGGTNKRRFSHTEADCPAVKAGLFRQAPTCL